MTRFTFWTDFCNDDTLWSPLNLKGMSVMNLLNSTTVGCVQYLKYNDALVSLTIDHISHEPALLHHITHICSSMLMGDTYLVAVSGFRNKAQTVRLPPTIKYLDCIVDVEVPEPKLVLNATTSK